MPAKKQTNKTKCGKGLAQSRIAPDPTPDERKHKTLYTVLRHQRGVTNPINESNTWAADKFENLKPFKKFKKDIKELIAETQALIIQHNLNELSAVGYITSDQFIEKHKKIEKKLEKYMKTLSPDFRADHAEKWANTLADNDIRTVQLALIRWVSENIARR